MSAQPTKEKPYMAGAETFATADEAVAHAEQNGFRNAGFKFWPLNAWFGPREQMKAQADWAQKTQWRPWSPR